jgi:hypothetical protein
VRKRAGKENKGARSAPELGQIARFARNFGYSGTLYAILALGSPALLGRLRKGRGLMGIDIPEEKIPALFKTKSPELSA